MPADRSERNKNISFHYRAPHQRVNSVLKVPSKVQTNPINYLLKMNIISRIRNWLVHVARAATACCRLDGRHIVAHTQFLIKNEYNFRSSFHIFHLRPIFFFSLSIHLPTPRVCACSMVQKSKSHFCFIQFGLVSLYIIYFNAKSNARTKKNFLAKMTTKTLSTFSAFSLDVVGDAKLFNVHLASCALCHSVALITNAKWRTTLAAINWFPFRSRSGDDAQPLNASP